jgi:tetrahydromethanopterin S-methyltransferase subunit B
LALYAILFAFPQREGVYKILNCLSGVVFRLLVYCKK